VTRAYFADEKTVIIEVGDNAGKVGLRLNVKLVGG